jgi:integrase
MGLTRRKDGYYVEFSVVDEGKILTLAPPGAGKLKRWKVGSRNRGYAKDQEAMIKTRLLSGQMPSPSMAKASATTFRQWAAMYLQLESVKKLKSYSLRRLYVAYLTQFFGDKLLAAITPDDVRRYRAQRVRYRSIRCAVCQKLVRQKMCACGWDRHDTSFSASVQTINHDHTVLTHMLNMAWSPQFRLINDNPAAYVPKPNPQNERDRIAMPEEWDRLQRAASPHLRRLLTVLYSVGPRKGELLKLEWPDVDVRRKEFTLRAAKNGETRVVPMTPDVYDVFVELWRERRLDTQRVFLYKGKPMGKVGTAFKAACRRAGVIGLRMHDLRHTASTNLRRAGVDTTTAMKIVGHKSERMHRRYNTIEPEDLHRAVSKLAAYQANTLITPGSDAVGAEKSNPLKFQRERA